MTTTEAVSYDPYAYAFHEDPYPTYEALRQHAPLYRSDEHDFWALSRHEDVLWGFKNSDDLSSAHGVTLDKAATGPDAHRTMSFLAMDEPRHGRMRGLVSRAFTPRRVAELEPRIRALAVEYLDQAVAKGSFDFIAEFAGKLPMDVISELVGVPTADRAELRRLADLVVHREDGMNDVPPQGIAAALDLVVYYTELLADRRRNMGDDLTSALLVAEIDGDKLSDDEIISFLFLMVVAGNETTTKLLGNAWYWAWRNPDQRQLVFSGDASPTDWVEETLRFDTSSQMLARRATRPLELHGATIPEGGRVLLLVGSANRDERVFGDAERYDLRRTDGSPNLLSFGFGRHFCLGASLARLEARVALEELLARVATYDIDADNLVRVHSVNVRGFASVPTTVVPV